MKLGKRQRALLVLSVLLLGLGMIALDYHLKAKRALADYQKQLVAAGEKLTVDEATPAPVPADKNGVGLYYRSLTLMNVQQEIFRTNPPAAMTMVAPGKARIGWTQPDIRSAKATNSWADAVVIASSLSNGLASLEGLIDRPCFDFNLNYHTGFTLLLPHLAQTKQTAQMLLYAALCDLHWADSESATRRLRALLAIAQGSADERLVISQLVRIAVAAIGAAGTWELLQSPNVTDAQLAQIQNDWNRLEFTLSAENALVMERAMGQMTLEQMRESSAEFRKVATGFAWPAAAPAAPGGDWFDQAEQLAKDTWDKGRLKAKETAWRFSWAYTDQLRTLKGLQAMLDATRQAHSNGNFHAASQELESQLTALGFHNLAVSDDSFQLFGDDVDVRTMFSQSILSLTSFLKRVTTAEANRQLVLTAIALQRYKLRHGNYPTSLELLVPEILPTAPRDPVDGKPLRYIPHPHDFLLYSVGEDGEDNSGDPKPAREDSRSFAWQRGHDWVWPQPATQQEVEDYYRRESKER